MCVCGVCMSVYYSHCGRIICMCVWCVHECVLYTLWEDNLHVCVVCA